MTRVEQDDNFFLILRKFINVDRYVVAVLAFAVLAAIVINVMNVSQPLLEAHGFRQTQTALTSYYLAENGFSLRYETPVIGEGWSVPFEFPIYQAIVAAASSLTGFGLAASGRVVSLLAVLLTCIPIWHILLRLGVDRRAANYALALFLTSPVYMFWSGTFMIEGAALLFTCCFVYYAIKLLRRSFSATDLILMAFFLSLALLQKVTTVLPVLAVICVYAFFFGIRVRDLSVKPAILLGVLLSFLVPVLLGLAWVKFSDAVKMENPIGSALTSGALSKWNYGTLHQRFSKELWLDVIYGRNIRTTAFFGLGFVFAVFGLFYFKERGVRAAIGGGLILFLFPFFVFSNLHLIHDYYQLANSVFLSVAVGVAVVYTFRRFLSRWPVVQSLLLSVFVVSNSAFFYNIYYPRKVQEFGSDQRTLLLADYVKQHTPKDRPVIWYGFDWSGEVAFYSERKSLTVPAWGNLDVEVVQNMRKFLSRDPAAIVHCPTGARDPLIHEAIVAKYGAIASTKMADCEIYFP